jgi:hypothetical protein
MNKLTAQIQTILSRQFPQNYIIQKPLRGTLVFMVIVFCFASIYQPLGVQGARSFSVSFTMLIYCLLISLSVLGMAYVLKGTNCFSKLQGWTVAKELLSLVLILIIIGFSAYFSAFIIEKHGSRWNLYTFFDSFYRSVLICIIPLLFSSLIHIRFAFTPEISQEFPINIDKREKLATEEMIYIKSKAKKEELSFLPHEFIYATSEGNYVIFHLQRENKNCEIMIRNSVNEIEQQLAGFPYFMRTHRAFIVNLEKVISKKGNSLGYQLKVKGSNEVIPVSRNNTRQFDELTRQIFLSVRP